jgi:DNA-binding transcriptional regulator GbsR (MarR family)
MMEKTILLSDNQKQLIEELGVLYEQNHLTPVMSRILALLVVSNETELTFDQIREALNISKSAASNALNWLLVTKSVVYVTKPHDRKRYFRGCFGHFGDEIRQHFSQMDEVVAVLRKILQQRPASTPEFNQNLGKVIRFFEFVAGEIPLLFQKWEQRNQ